MSWSHVNNRVQLPHYVFVCPSRTHTHTDTLIIHVFIMFFVLILTTLVGLKEFGFSSKMHYDVLPE